VKHHFVYSVPGHRIKAARVGRKLAETMQRFGMPVSAIGRRENVNVGVFPPNSPYSITKQLYQAFSGKGPTLLYDLSENVRCSIQPDDIFIGHPMFPWSEGCTGVTERTIAESQRPRIRALIVPLHCNTKVKTSHINLDFLQAVDNLMPEIDILFGIMGQYWWDQWDQSPFANWKSKMVRLDMALDVVDFPRVKKRFNHPGKRGYLYIGKNDPMKGIDILSTLMQRLDAYPCGWIGAGPDIPGIPRISRERALTPQFMAEVAERFDFFVSASVADPNPTTILESMAWGFPVICTPQSGYYQTPYITNIYPNDLQKSQDILLQLQHADEGTLLRTANEARYVVEHEYNWEHFTSTILETIEHILAEREYQFSTWFKNEI
jgi:glycosyltransferase involved in cell wall biosynthesis